LHEGNLLKEYKTDGKNWKKWILFCLFILPFLTFMGFFVLFASSIFGIQNDIYSRIIFGIIAFIMISVGIFYMDHFIKTINNYTELKIYSNGILLPTQECAKGKGEFNRPRKDFVNYSDIDAIQFWTKNNEYERYGYVIDFTGVYNKLIAPYYRNKKDFHFDLRQKSIPNDIVYLNIYNFKDKFIHETSSILKEEGFDAMKEIINQTSDFYGFYANTVQK